MGWQARTASCWMMKIACHNNNNHRRLHCTPSCCGMSVTAVYLSTSPQEDGEQLRSRAKKLRDEIDSFEQKKRLAELAILRREEDEQALEQIKRERYSALVPILKPDGSTSEERCEFMPRWREDCVSFICIVESELPIGVILGESELFPGFVSVDDVGLQVGDLVQAFTACRMEMDRPSWQLMVGGIGRPRTVRFMYSADNRPFEEVLNAVGSNRMDPQARPVLIVVERREAPGSEVSF
jgi:hypothetical protein